MSVLLTYEAVRAAALESDPTAALWRFVTYHRTEGREVGVEQLAEIMASFFFPEDACEVAAQAIWTALFEEATDA